MSNKLYNDNSTPLVSVCPKCVVPLSFKQLKSIVLKKHKMIESKFSLLINKHLFSGKLY